MRKSESFPKKLVIINVGVKPFVEGVREQGVRAVQVNWRPPSDKKLGKLLGKVL